MYKQSIIKAVDLTIATKEHPKSELKMCPRGHVEICKQSLVPAVCVLALWRYGCASVLAVEGHISGPWFPAGPDQCFDLE